MGILSGGYDKKVIRRKIREGQDKTILDEAKVIEEEDSEQKLIKFKSDGKEIPKPGDGNFEQLWYRKWWERLMFIPKKPRDFIEIKETDDEIEFIEFNINQDDDEIVRTSEKNHLFQTHRNILARKTVEAWSGEDNTQLWLAAYLSVLALITLGGMYVLTTGVEEAIKEGLTQGLSSAGDAASSASGSSGASELPGVGN